MFLYYLETLSICQRFYSFHLLSEQVRKKINRDKKSDIRNLFHILLIFYGLIYDRLYARTNIQGH
mgnify:CR=1 FL=1